MKKSLLTCAAALMALAATAQTANMKGSVITSQRINELMSTQTATNLVASNAEVVAAKPRTIAKIVKAAENDDNVFGYFVHSHQGTDVAEFTSVSIDTIWKANQTVKIVVDEQGNTEDVACNVCLKSAFGGYRVSEVVYGVYEEGEDEGSLWFPEQISLKADGVSQNGQEYHYDIYMYSYELDDKGTSLKGAYPLQFEEVDGVFYNSYDGWGLFYVDRTTGKGLGWGAFVQQSELKNANGTVEWDYYDRDAKEWVTINSDAYIEDYGTQAAVYGWNGTKLSMLIDDDLTVKIRTGAPIADVDIKAEDGYMWDAGQIVLRGYNVDEEGNLSLDLNSDYIYGELKGNTITFPIIASSSQNGGTGDYEGYWYGLNYYQNNTFKLNEGNFAKDKDYNGIENHSMSLEEYIKNTKTFNLMGQQVNRSLTKGLLVREGKKFINK